MIGLKTRKKIRPALEKIAKPLVRAKVSANTITITSLILAVIGGAAIITKNYPAAAALVVISSAMDVIDGAVARASKKHKGIGNYLDAMVDRLREYIIYTSLAITGYAVESCMALGGSLLVSYAKARTGLVIKIENDDWPGIGEQTERLIILITGLTLEALGIRAMKTALYLIITITLIGTFQRMLHAKKLIKKFLKTS